jgi:hypothetical protein
MSDSTITQSPNHKSPPSKQLYVKKNVIFEVDLSLIYLSILYTKL